MLSRPKRSRFLTCCIGLIFVQSIAQADLWGLFNPEVNTLRSQAVKLENELEVLGPMPLGSSTIEQGSQYHMAIEQLDEPAWAMLDLGSSRQFDKLMIVPAITRMDLSGSVAYAFPKSFYVEVSDFPKFDTSRIVAEFEDTSFEGKEGLPIVINTANTKARFVRISVTKMPQVANRYTFALGEIFVISGNLNISASAKAVMYMAPQIPPNWHPRFLVDGRTPLGEPIEIELPEFDGAYSGAGTIEEPSFMEVDLNQIHLLEEIRLHPIHARLGASLPGYGFPKKFQIQIATNRKSNYTTVYHSGEEPFTNPGNNPVYFPLDRLEARYIKIVALEPGIDFRDRFGLSEIQAYSENKNVALNHKVTFSHPFPGQDSSRITDGYASYGKILELPAWLDRWDRLRTIKLAMLKNRLGLTQALSAAKKRFLLLLTSVLLIGTSIVFMDFYRRKQRQRVEKIRFRERLAQDLHDDIGGNLAAIARIGEVAELENKETQALADWQAVRQLALESTDSMRETLWLLGGPEHANEGLAGRLHRAAKRMLPDLAIQWEQDASWSDMKEARELSRELFLTFKEIIANIAKHADATKVKITLNRTDDLWELKVEDNGIGFNEPHSSGMGLSNIRHRINRLNGSVSIDSKRNSGTVIKIKIPTTV